MARKMRLAKPYPDCSPEGTMSAIPREPGFDSTRELLADPYRYIGTRCRAHGAPLFRTRILLRSTICMSGAQAAQLFYDPRRFVRSGAAPEPVRATLFGKGGVQGLDGEAHRHRKRLFLGLLESERALELARLTETCWESQAAQWAGRDRVVLYDEVQRLLTRAVCAWAGAPLAEAEIAVRTHNIAALFDRTGAVGGGHLQSRLARRRSERWIEEIIAGIRAGRIRTSQTSAARAIAWHRELDGSLLPLRIAAVELLNVLRPVVAIAVYIVFAAHALALHPECRARIEGGDDAYLDGFVEEVRRYYPFFPAVAARVRSAFRWQGYAFAPRERVLLDLYGTNHAPEIWDAPEAFEPRRFESSRPSPYELIPQGGGEHARSHRCPGEWATIEVMKTAAAFLCRRMRYTVPPQDFAVAFERLPALPRSRLVIAHVQV